MMTTEVDASLRYLSLSEPAAAMSITARCCSHAGSYPAPCTSSDRLSARRSSALQLPSTSRDDSAASSPGIPSGMFSDLSASCTRGTLLQESSIAS